MNRHLTGHLEIFDGFLSHLETDAVDEMDLPERVGLAPVIPPVFSGVAGDRVPILVDGALVSDPDSILVKCWSTVQAINLVELLYLVSKPAEQFEVIFKSRMRERSLVWQVAELRREGQGSDSKRIVAILGLVIPLGDDRSVELSDVGHEGISESRVAVTRVEEVV